MQEYIHYGNKEFKEELFRPIKNRENFVKPNGGLWASRITDVDYLSKRGVDIFYGK